MLYRQQVKSPHPAHSLQLPIEIWPRLGCQTAAEIHSHQSLMRRQKRWNTWIQFSLQQPGLYFNIWINISPQSHATVPLTSDPLLQSHDHERLHWPHFSSICLKLRAGLQRYCCTSRQRNMDLLCETDNTSAILQNWVDQTVSHYFTHFPHSKFFQSKIQVWAVGTQ